MRSRLTVAIGGLALIAAQAFGQVEPAPGESPEAEAPESVHDAGSAEAEDAGAPPAATQSAPEDAGPWEVVLEGRVTVKARERAGSPVREVWAEGPIDAPAIDIQEALIDAERFPKFMPYVRESRRLKAESPDGARLMYTRLELPIVTSRDYVTLVQEDELVGADGTGEFRQRWEAVNDLLPSRANVIRVQLNEGGWNVKPDGEERSWAVFRTTIDPGGWLPNFAVEMGNKTAMTKTFEAVEKEAKRRYKDRKKAQALKK